MLKVFPKELYFVYDYLTNQYRYNIRKKQYFCIIIFQYLPPYYIYYIELCANYSLFLHYLHCLPWM